VQLNAEQVDRGRAESARDIKQGSPKLFWGTRGSWGEFMARLMAERFAVSVVHIDCFTSVEKQSFEHGYNAATAAHIDATFGDGAYQAALDEVEAYRQQQYRKYLANQTPKI
jgi:hypothetical protein